MNSLKSRQGRWFMATLFVLYIAVLFYLVFLSNAYGRNNQEILRYQNINLIPFKTINNYLHAWDVVDPSVVITNVYGNILAFLPFGFLGPMVLKRLRKLIPLFIYSTLFSFSIEAIQGLLGVGVVDVDDLILNVFGALIGFCLYVLMRRFYRHKKSGKQNN